MSKTTSVTLFCYTRGITGEFSFSRVTNVTMLRNLFCQVLNIEKGKQMGRLFEPPILITLSDLNAPGRRMRDLAHELDQFESP